MGDNGQANVHCRFVDGNRQQKCSVVLLPVAAQPIGSLLHS